MPLAPGSSRGIVGANIREMQASGYPHAQAVAAALSNADRHPRRAEGGVVDPSRGIVGYAYGGAPMAGGMGIAPQTAYLAPSTQTQNPQEQDVLSRFAALPTEKLQELAVQFGNTGQGAALQRVLAQRHYGSDTASGIAPQGYAEGGTAFPEDQFQRDVRERPGYREWYQGFQKRYGEAPNLDDKQYDYRKAWQNGIVPQPYAPDGGFPHWSSATGKGEALKSTDHPMKWMEDFMQATGQDPNTYQSPTTAPPQGMYPSYARGGYADGGGPEGFGEAASMARHVGHSAPTTGFLHSEVPGRTDLIHAGPPTGAFVIPADVVSGVGQGNSLAGAWMLQKALGMGPLRRTGGIGIPSPPPRFTEPLMGSAAKRGGRQAAKDAQIGQPTHILAAGGEFIVTPDQVRAWGHGDMNRGHSMLDAWVVKKRKQIIEEMKALKGPKQ